MANVLHSSVRSKFPAYTLRRFHHWQAFRHSDEKSEAWKIRYGAERKRQASFMGDPNAADYITFIVVTEFSDILLDKVAPHQAPEWLDWSLRDSSWFLKRTALGPFPGYFIPFNDTW